MNTQSSDKSGTPSAGRQAAAGAQESSVSYIEHALELKSTVGTMCAIEFMKAHDVAPEMIVQVATAASERARH